MPTSNARLTIRMTQVTSNKEPYHYTRLEVDDATSGLTIASIELSPKDVVDLISSRLVGDVDGLPAYLIEPEMRGALGCHTFNTKYHFPSSRHTEEAVEAWAKRTSGALDAAKYRTSKNNSGQIVVLFTYYTKATLPAVIDDIMQERQATMDVAAKSLQADR